MWYRHAVSFAIPSNLSQSVATCKTDNVTFHVRIRTHTISFRRFDSIGMDTQLMLKCVNVRSMCTSIFRVPNERCDVIWCALRASCRFLLSFQTNSNMHLVSVNWTTIIPTHRALAQVKRKLTKHTARQLCAFNQFLNIVKSFFGELYRIFHNSNRIDDGGWEIQCFQMIRFKPP